MSSHITLVTLILWRIWKCCNERLYNGHTIEPQIAVYMSVKEYSCNGGRGWGEYS